MVKSVEQHYGNDGIVQRILDALTQAGHNIDELDAIRSIKLFATRVADVALEGQEIFQASRKDVEKPEEQKPEPPAKSSGEDEQGEKVSAEPDPNSENEEEKIPV